MLPIMKTTFQVGLNGRVSEMPEKRFPIHSFPIFMHKLPLALLGAAIMTGCSTVQHHRSTADVTLTLNLPGAVQTGPGEGRDLDLRFVNRNRTWVSAIATARRWNAATHRVDPSGLTLSTDGQLAGHVTVTLLPDSWVPKDQQPRVGHVSLTANLSATNVVGRFEAEFSGQKTNGAVTGTVGPIPAPMRGDKAGMLRTFLPQRDGKLAEAVFRFEARGPNVIRLDAAKIGVNALAVTINDDRLCGIAKLAWDEQPPVEAKLDLSCIGDEIGGLLTVGSHWLSVTGRLESRADLSLQNRTEKLNPHSDARQQTIKTATTKGGADGLADAFARQTWKAADGVELPYRLFTPSNLVPGQKYPLVVFLHGAGQAGNDNEKQLNSWPKYWATDDVQSAHPCFVLAPQTTGSWGKPPIGAATNATTTGQMVIHVLRDMQTRMPVDPARIYVTGLSRGGFGACYLLAEAPDLFAAGVPVCGASAELAPRIGKTPIWILHGDADTTVPVVVSRDLVKALRALGASPLYTEYHLVGHNSYFYAYTNPAVYEWLFNQRR